MDDTRVLHQSGYDILRLTGFRRCSYDPSGARTFKKECNQTFYGGTLRVGRNDSETDVYLDRVEEKVSCVDK